ncbi:DUF2243 domain-containing protein [Geodermatophilus sabuli]|uniref:Uncharacterized membrane protein n=1 Tax=Geodermatophilus sabuli TaxID=1564158 RepID=A0A285EIZ5_9ACTN|nr:DUF2243 domain-containing protein [Geodermatophilus sabuli]MBB3083009.1 putative membrane protein [Geodermatophilus sabuli]SNX98006.1 Uncharacterized membrane protein [Geodermatophilus sabuli]
MTDARVVPGRLLLSGLLSGAGLMGAVDEIVFHQLLHWHHFYDRASGAAGLVSDGVLHAATLSAVVAGLALLADVRRRGEFDRLRWWGAVLLGAGAFQLWDGVVDHKLLRVHQVRYGVDLAPYDAAWIGAAAVLVIAGALLTLRTRRR